MTADFIEMTANTYTVEEMRQMETIVLSVIEFDINCTPSQTFLEHYSRRFNVTNPSVLIYASFLLDLALLKDEFLQFKTSDITVCALIIAMNRESSLTGRSFDAELHRLHRNRGFENFDDETYKKCLSCFSHCSDPNRLDSESKLVNSLVLKYAHTGVVHFSRSLVQSLRDE